MLSTEGLCVKYQNIQTIRRGLLKKRIEPFEIMGKLSENAMKLKLPKYTKTLLSFNVEDKYRN